MAGKVAINKIPNCKFFLRQEVSSCKCPAGVTSLIANLMNASNKKYCSLCVSGCHEVRCFGIWMYNDSSVSALRSCREEGDGRGR